MRGPWVFFNRPGRPDKNGLVLLVSIFVLAASAISLSLFAHKMADRSNSLIATAFKIPAAPAWPDDECHGALKLAELDDPIQRCLGPQQREAGEQTLYLLGDSHAAQLLPTMKRVAAHEHKSLAFINTEDRGEFPYSFWTRPAVQSDKILDYALAAMRKGDLLVISFHRGRFNQKINTHLALTETVTVNPPSANFLENMRAWLPKFEEKGVKIILFSDTPLLSYITTIETCYFQTQIFGANSCRVSRTQDPHTRSRQNTVFARLEAEFSQVHVFDPLPFLYGNQKHFDPIESNTPYRMVDWNHLTTAAAQKLLNFPSNIGHMQA